MPLYQFINDETEETVDVFFHMNDEKRYFDESGKEWRRVYTSPMASIDTKIDPFSSQQFVEKTGNKKGSIGDLQDRAAELSKIRAEKAGKDPVKEKFLANYKKSTGKNFLDTNSPKVVEKNGFKVRIEK